MAWPKLAASAPLFPAERLNPVIDPYKTLGVPKEADQDAVKSAYRKLAKQYHPDLNPGDAQVEQRFKEISQAYGILGDPEKRKRFDRGEIDSSGQEKPGRGGFYRTYAESGQGAKYGPHGFGFRFDQGLDDIFEDLFGGTRPGTQGRSRTTVRRRGADVSYKLTVSFLEAATGAKKRLGLADGKKLDVTVPAGTEDGQSLRLKGQGMSGLGGAPAGDALIEISVETHPSFRREGLDIHLDLPITLKEAVLGATIDVPTIHGRVSMKIPAGSNSGTRLRLKGKGVKGDRGSDAGDQYVTARVVLPDTPDDSLRDFAEGWQPPAGYDPRRRAGLD